jgi:tetratricopeptide (TPR) repeat protein
LQTLKKDFGSDKMWHTLNVLCAQFMDSVTYQNELREYGNLFSNDPSWYLVGIDYYWNSRDWDAAKELIFRLNERVGYDPVLTWYMGLVEFEQGNYAVALTLAEEAIAELPAFESVYFLKMSAQGRLGDFSGMANTIRFLSNEFKTDLDDIDLTHFQDFEKSKEYANLKKELHSY